ncbi:MAG: MFS transporter [Planctomycetota bacterium]|nr:MFS transporter [Planctomycetota bacterium]
MTPEHPTTDSTGTGRNWPLYGAAFATALSLGICWTAMPFVLTAIGGTETHVGYALAGNSLAYMAALVFAGSLLGHLDVKWATRLATVAALVAAIVMVAAVFGSGRRNGTDGIAWIWMIIAAGGFGGAAMALFWPFLMSWVSARFEGVELNRQLGRYNGSWSSGGLVGPVIGAWLVEQNPLWPMVAAVACFAASLALLGLARNNAGHADEAALPGPAAEPLHDGRSLAAYRWMSRVALFCAWASQAIVRSQFALLFVALGHSEAQFGVYYAVFALCNFLSLTTSGRWAFWHFRLAPLLTGQVMLLAALLMMIYGRTLSVFVVSAIVLGLPFGFAYSSHLYYGAATSRNRSARMTIHEMVISIGIVTGAGTGGHLARHVGPYAPYWFAVTLVGLGLIAQLAIHFTSSCRAARRQTS